MKDKIFRYFYYIWKRASEVAKRKKYRRIFDEYFVLFEKYENKKDKKTIKKELKALQSYWLEYPFHYYEYGLYRKECTLSMDELKGMLPFYFSNFLLYPRSYSSYLPIVEEKSLTKSLFSSFEIQHTPTLFELNGSEIYSPARDVMSIEVAENKIKSCSAEKIFVKPNHGSQGKGIMVYLRKGEDYYNLDGVKLNMNSLMEDCDGKNFIVEEGIRQHEILSEIYPHSVNTFRVFTEYRNGESLIHYVVFRMGMDGHHVDNAHYGGVFCAVDLENGILRGPAHSYTFDSTPSHPNTGTKFEGIQLPYWPQCLELIHRCVLKFRQFKYLGWDLAISESGPLIVEANGKPDQKLVQYIYGPAKEKLGIGDPKSYYRSANFTIKDL